MTDGTTPSRPLRNRYDVAVDIFIFICSTFAIYLIVAGGRHGFWKIVSLMLQIALAAMTIYRLSRVDRMRIRRD